MACSNDLRLEGGVLALGEEDALVDRCCIDDEVELLLSIVHSGHDEQHAEFAGE